MAEYYSHQHRQFTCIDAILKPVAGSTVNQNGLLFYFVKGRCGAPPCPPYDEIKDIAS